MARPKGSKNKPKIEGDGGPSRANGAVEPEQAKAAGPGPGHNSRALTDDQEMALHFQHRDGYKRFLAAKKKADADLRNFCKTIKADGGDVADVKLSVDLETEEGEKRFQQRMEREARVARWNGVGIQTSMFGTNPTDLSVGERAYDEGKRACMNNEPRKPPYHPTTLPQYESWMNGYNAGQEILTKGFKRPGEGVNGDGTPVGSKPKDERQGDIEDAAKGAASVANGDPQAQPTADPPADPAERNRFAAAGDAFLEQQVAAQKAKDEQKGADVRALGEQG